jgi:predicted TIM-barrel fold metal-dependent hydrolase
VSKYKSFDAAPVAPLGKLPAGACDCHFHVFGDRMRYPVLPGIEHDMPEATFEALLKLHRALGIGRGVICATTVNGSNHQVVLDALEALGPDYRACALNSVFEDQPDSYIRKLHDAGVRGARFNLLKMLNRAPSPDRIRRDIARIRDMGWYCKVQPDYHEPLESIAPFEKLGSPVVIDHMGRADSPDGPVTRKMLALLERGNFWLLLSNAYKVSKAGPPWDDMAPVLRRFIDAAPDRLLWASDWPHTFHEVQPPNDGDLLNFFYRATSDDERAKILVRNPEELFFS